MGAQSQIDSPRLHRGGTFGPQCYFTWIKHKYRRVSESCAGGKIPPNSIQLVNCYFITIINRTVSYYNGSEWSRRRFLIEIQFQSLTAWIQFPVTLLWWLERNKISLTLQISVKTFLLIISLQTFSHKARRTDTKYSTIQRGVWKAVTNLHIRQYILISIQNRKLVPISVYPLILNL